MILHKHCSDGDMCSYMYHWHNNILSDLHVNNTLVLRGDNSLLKTFTDLLQISSTILKGDLQGNLGGVAWGSDFPGKDLLWLLSTEDVESCRMQGKVVRNGRSANPSITSQKTPGSTS